MRTRALFASALLAATLAVACSSQGPAAQGTTTGPSLPTTNPSSLAPTPTRSLDPYFDWGQTVFITTKGLIPQQLQSSCCLAVTWVNQTDATQSFRFDHQFVASGPIPPGGSFSWKPANVESVVYHMLTGAKLRGVVQVNPAQP